MDASTNLSTSTEESQTPEPSLRERYYIDPAWYQQEGRSFILLLQERMCTESLAKLGKQRETRAQVEDATTKKAYSKRRTTTRGNDPITIIQECCSKTADYREPRLPLKELLARLLLADGNRPKSIEELYAEVKTWIEIGDTRVITPEVIQRILQRDDYYGFARVPEESS